jgi:hypothetical protein
MNIDTDIPNNQQGRKLDGKEKTGFFRIDFPIVSSSTTHSKWNKMKSFWTSRNSTEQR